MTKKEKSEKTATGSSRTTTGNIRTVRLNTYRERKNEALQLELENEQLKRTVNELREEIINHREARQTLEASLVDQQLIESEMERLAKAIPEKPIRKSQLEPTVIPTTVVNSSESESSIHVNIIENTKLEVAQLTSETPRRNESPNTIGKRLSMEEKKCKTLQTEYRDLNLQHQKSKESLSTVEEEKQKLEDKINLLNAETDRKIEEATVIAERAASHKIVALEEKIEALSKSHSDYKDEELKKKYIKLESQLEDRKEKNEQLEKQLQTLKETHQMAVQDSSKLQDDLKAKDRLHKATTEALESKIDILEMDLKRVSMAQSDGESSASSDDETIDRLKEEVENLQDALNAQKQATQDALNHNDEISRNFETKLTAAKDAPRAESELLKSEMDKLQKDLKNFADREESLAKQVSELRTEKEEAKNQENEHMQSLEEEISILSQQEEQYQEQIKKLENDNSNMSKIVKGAELKSKKDIEQFKNESNEVIKNLKNENAATEKQFEDFKKDSEKTIQTYLESFDKEKKNLKNKHDAELETVNAEVDRLTDENEKNRSDIENMTAQVNQAKEESSKKEADAQKARADADEAKSELEKQLKAHENFLNESKNKNEQIEKMKGLLKDKVGEIVEKSKEVNSLTDKLDQLKTDSEQQQARISQLESESDEATEAMKNAAQLKKQIAELQKQNSDLVTKLNEQIILVNQVQAKTPSPSHSKSPSCSSLSQISDELSAEQLPVKQATSLTDRAVTEIDDSILEELTSQLKQSKSLFEEKDDQNKKLMNTMRILEEEIDFLKSENDKKTLALDLAKANLARVGPKDSSPDSSQESGPENELVEDLDDELDKMRIRLNQKDEIISELKSEIESKTEDFTNLENQVEQLASKFSSNSNSTESEIKEKISSLQEQIQNLEKENLDLKEENIELMQSVEKDESCQDKYKMIEAKMEELSIILESKQSELDQKDELVKKVGEFNDIVDKLKVELSETKEERDRLGERIEELEQDTREKYEFESQRSGTPPDTLADTLAEQNSKLQNYEDLIDQKSNEIEDLKDQIERLCKGPNTLARDNEVYRVEIENLKRQNIKFRQEIENNVSQIYKLQDETNGNSERIDYDRSIENQMEMINQQNHEIDSLREDLRSKDENISRLRHVNVELIERLRTTQQSTENVLNVGDRRAPR